MSELQNEPADSEVIEQAASENPDNGAELATASESEHSTNPEKVEVDDVESEASKQQAYINKQYGTIKQGERELATANEELDKLKSADRDRQAAAVGTLPEILDALDDGYEDSLDAYKKAVQAQATYNATNNALVQQQQLQQQQAAQAKQVKQNEAMAAYATKATELGIKQDDLTAAAAKVSQYGLTDDLVMHILEDSDGPLITQHLAANPQDGYQLAQMSPFAVGAFLTEIKQKASALKPKTSNTPAPADTLSGNGVDPESGKYKYIGGSQIDIGESW